MWSVLTSWRGETCWVVVTGGCFICDHLSRCWSGDNAWQGFQAGHGHHIGADLAAGLVQGVHCWHRQQGLNWGQTCHVTCGVWGGWADRRGLVHTCVHSRVKWRWRADVGHRNGVDVIVVGQVLVLCPVYLNWSQGGHIGHIWRWNWSLENVIILEL